MIPSFPAKTIDAGDYSTAYIDVGAGEPVLLLHSVDPGCSGLLEYRHNIGPLSETFRVTVPDLVGFGQTARFEHQPASVSQAYVDHILAFMDALGIEQAHMVGNSRGGLIAIAIAMQTPRKVNRIVLLGNAGGGPSQEYMTVQAARYGNFKPNPEALRDFLSGSFYSLDRDVPPDVFQVYLQNSIPQYEAYERIGGLTSDVPDFRKALATVGHPILYMFGKEDERWPPLPEALEIFTATPNSRFYVISRCGHHPQTEYSADFNILAAGFLQGALAVDA